MMGFPFGSGYDDIACPERRAGGCRSVVEAAWFRREKNMERAVLSNTKLFHGMQQTGALSPPII
jgi:hypothetical protein